MPLTNLLENKLEFMIQAHQSTTVIDAWPFYEFQIYIDLLNQRNKEREAKNTASTETTDNKSSGLLGSLNRMANKFKKPKV